VDERPDGQPAYTRPIPRRSFPPEPPQGDRDRPD
jgi:hypothetical protein